MKVERAPFVGLRRGILDGIHFERLGTAFGLFSFLVDRQTAASGIVNYGRPIGYDWLAGQIPNLQPERTVARWLRRLRRFGYIRTRRVPYGGNVIHICNPKKWATQLPLPFAKPSEILRKKCG